MRMAGKSLEKKPPKNFCSSFPSSLSNHIPWLSTNLLRTPQIWTLVPDWHHTSCPYTLASAAMELSVFGVIRNVGGEWCKQYRPNLFPGTSAEQTGCPGAGRRSGKVYGELNIGLSEKRSGPWRPRGQNQISLKTLSIPIRNVTWCKPAAIDRIQKASLKTRRTLNAFM